MIEYIALPLVKKIAFIFFGKISKKLQLKYFPLDLKKFDIECNSTPQIRLNYAENYCYLEFFITLKNYTNYEIKVLGAQCNLNINSYIFTETMTNQLLVLQPSAQGSYAFKKNFTYFEAKKAEQLFNGEQIAQGNFRFNFILKSIYQEQNHSFDKYYDIKISN